MTFNRNCKHCQKSFTTQNIEQGFCSTACNQAARQDPMFIANKKEAKKRDNYRCQHCNRTADYANKVYLEVHHIDGLAEGGSHELENLLTLCPNCHRAEHKRLRKIAYRNAQKEARQAKKIA
jgi:5-methylcytosine-specific restriction protein A